jgi:prepilin-type N-terminal cleavage/methylation domain-containing protein
MKTTHRRINSDYANDAGMTLVEVLVAVIVVVIVALAGAGVTVNGINTATSQERNQVAVTIANGVMEKISGWQVATNSSTHVSNLYTGRCTSDVNKAFSDNSTKPGVSSTYQVSDTVATAASTCNAASFQPEVVGTGPGTPGTQNGTNYTIATLIGACYEPVTGGSCGLLTGKATPPATTPAGYTPLIRAIVIVSWTAGTACKVNGCYYEATSLIDANDDLQWVAHA